VISQYAIQTKMKKYTYTEKKDTRSGFGAGLHEAGKRNSNVVALCADLVGSLKRFS
jgi:transketolase